MSTRKTPTPCDIKFSFPLSRVLESLWEPPHVVLERTLVAEELNVGAVDADLAGLALGDVVVTAERSETPVLGDDDLLATWELVLGTTESLDGSGAVCEKIVSRTIPTALALGFDKLTRVTSADGQNDLANVDTSDETVWLAESTTHTGLQSIGTSARQHLVDADDVVRVWADAHVESFLSGNLDQVLVGGDTGGLKRLGRELLKLVGNQVHACWELVDVGALAA